MAMNRFAPALRRLARQLDLPAAVRAAIVLEMAADLETVYEHHLRQGVGEAEAERRAEEMVLGSSEVAGRLERVHRDSWHGWPHRLAAPGRVDLLLLVAAVLPVAAISGAVGLRTAAVSAGPIVWPLVAVGVVLVVVTAVETGRMLGGRYARAQALPLLPALAAVAFALGLLAFVVEARAMAHAFAAGATDAVAMAVHIERLGKGGALFLVGLHLGVAGALSWFILVQRAAGRAVREVDALLATGAPPSAAARSPDVLPLRRRSQS
jgi:hypothetical protein